MNLGERKIINIFKSFIERVFVPQLSKMDASCQQEWNKFSSMIASQPLNIGEIQLYVDTLPSTGSSFNRPNFSLNDNKPAFFPKPKREVVEENPVGFNPSKTFGGQKARMMFPLKDFDEPPADRQNYNFSKDFSKDKEDPLSGFTTQNVLPTLEKLFKLFSENQTKMEKMGSTVTTPGTYEHRSYY